MVHHCVHRDSLSFQCSRLPSRRRSVVHVSLPPRASAQVWAQSYIERLAHWPAASQRSCGLDAPYSNISVCLTALLREFLHAVHSLDHASRRHRGVVRRPTAGAPPHDIPGPAAHAAGRVASVEPGRTVDAVHALRTELERSQAIHRRVRRLHQRWAAVHAPAHLHA